MMHSLNGNMQVPSYIVVNHPKSYVGGPIDGAFLVDSFHYFKKANRQKSFYIPDMLDNLKQRTGLTFMAVCGGGAALVKHTGSASYAELLQFVPAGITTIIAIICGNDFIAKWPPTPTYKPEWTAAAK